VEGGDSGEGGGLISSLIISVISKQHEDREKYGPGEDVERKYSGECDIITDCGHVWQRASGRPVLWDSIRSSEFLKWTPPSAELKQTKGVPADN